MGDLLQDSCVPFQYSCILLEDSCQPSVCKSCSELDISEQASDRFCPSDVRRFLSLYGFCPSPEVPQNGYDELAVESY